MTRHTNEDALVEELRADLPDRLRTERVRARLLAAGLAVGAGVSAAGAASAAGTASAAGAASAAGTASTAGLLAAETVAAQGMLSGAWSAFTALSWGAKLGITAAVCVSTGAGPLYLAHRASTRPAFVASASGRPGEERAARSTAHPVPAARSRASDALVAATASPVADHPAPSAPDVTTAGSASSPRAGRARAIGSAVPTERGPRAVTSELSFPMPEPQARTQDAAPAEAAAARTLAEETGLMDSAFAALRANELDRAERLIAEHQRRFANGHLSRERERAREKLAEARKPRL